MKPLPFILKWHLVLIKMVFQFSLHKSCFKRNYVKLFRRIAEALTEFLFEGNASRTFLLVKKILKQIKVHFWLAAKVELRFECPTWNSNRIESIIFVFCFQNCSDLLWEKIVIVIEKSSEQSLKQNACSWKFVRTTKLEQFELKIGI